MKLPAALPSLSVSTEQVVRSWPSTPFWLRRRASRETHLAAPGAAVAATSILAVLMAEPSLYRSGLHLFAFSLPAGSLPVFSLLAPLTTIVMLAVCRRPAVRWCKWADLLPVCGLFAVARALADLDRAGLEPVAELRPPELQRRPTGVLAGIGGVGRLLASLTARKGMAGQALLFGSHLGWLLAAAGQLAEAAAGWGFLLLGVVALHLLALAGARLMTTSASWHTTLASASWADNLVPPCLLLPLPLNLAVIGLWLWPRTQAQQDSLAAGVFGAQGPFKRLASFRRHLPVGGGLATHFKEWNGDPFSRLAESRLRRELRWTEVHRVALFFQALALLGALGALDLLEDDRLIVLFWVLVAVTITSSCLHALLFISGWISRTSRGLAGLSRVAGVAFTFALALAASPVWFLPAGEAFRLLTQVSSVGAFLSILRVPLDILVSPARIRSIPAALVRGMAFTVLAILLAVLSRQTPPAAQIQLVAILAGGSFFAAPLLLYLAERCEAPALVRSRWLCLPFSALLLPLLPSRLGQKALRSKEI